MPGVEAVLTHAQVRGSNRQGVIRKDQPVLVDDKVRHCGDAVALVVARDQGTLAAALGLIELELEPLEPVLDMTRALEPDAPLVHEDHPTGNILLAGELVSGRGQAALADCAQVVELALELPRQEHAFLETEAGWAILTPEGTLEIVASTQTPFRDRTEVAEALGLELEQVRVSAPYLGGGFGGKDGVTVQSLLGLAALACPGRPVKMWWSREESFLAGVKRHPARLHYRLGAESDGRLRALDADLCYDTGPYDHLGGVVMTLGLEHAGGPYRIEHVRLRARAVYTNNPVSGPFRGFGVPQAAAALEQAMDLMAQRLGLDPIELRRRNLARRGQRVASGARLDCSHGLEECLQKLAGHQWWRGRGAWKAQAGPFKRRGVGVAAVMHGLGYGPVVPDVANAKIELTPQGKIRVYSGVADMGQGNASTCLQIAGQVLNQGLENMELVLPDTERTLPSGSASASRTTFTYGQALIAASGQLRRRLLERAADLLFVASATELALLPGRVRHSASGRELPLARLAALMQESERVAVGRHRAPVSQERPTADEALRLHGLPHAVFSFATQLAAVELDELTGQVELKGFVSVCDCGRLLNQQLAEQQMQGAMAQGLGYALCEDFAVAGGRVQTPDLSTYLLPTSLDAPDMDSLWVQAHEPSGPFGLKGVGEVGMDGPLPAISNAVADACGLRAQRFPLTPERVLAVLGRPWAAGGRP
ncbi:MAG: xanthine dehydrogenase family protein molybdopterin-binding subunit [Desulfarculus sp.]|nr:MAG: xanthine dehydrogenase family protein molybdopterin-binding subunit [Desulfarculus sp.]